MEGKRPKFEWLRWSKGQISQKRLFLLFMTVIIIITPITTAAWAVTSGRCVILMVYTDRLAYTSGESIHVHARIINCGLKTVELTYPTSGDIFIHIIDNSGRRVFLAPENVFHCITKKVLEPGETLKREFTWDQDDRTGEDVRLPNSFLIIATSDSYDARYRAYSAPICISS